jgi:PAS domain S-box-containing protein
MLPRLLAGEKVTVDYRIIRPNDGATRWIRDSGFPIRDENGVVNRVAGVLQDITEDKERSEALAESEERFRLLVEGARDYAIFMIDPGDHIIYWSAGAERNFGWTSEEALGQSGELIFTPEDRANNVEQKEMHLALRDGVALDCRWHLRKDGSRIWVDGVMRRLDDEHGNLRGFAKIARDATRQRKAEQELEKSYAELENRVAARTAELTATNRQLAAEIKQRSSLEQEILLISEREKRRIGEDLHDSLCQELAAAAFFLQTGSHKVAESNPQEAQVLADAARIVNDNVGLARDLARGLHPVDLTATGLTTALRELAFRHSRDGVKVQFKCPKPVRVFDEAVTVSLYRIAQEAVNNALKSGKAKKIVITLERQRGKLILSIVDDGKGFSTRRPRKGLGLHLMKYRANSIGAKLTVESADGHGARITCVRPGK